MWIIPFMQTLASEIDCQNKIAAQKFDSYIHYTCQSKAPKGFIVPVQSLNNLLAQYAAKLFSHYFFHLKNSHQ